MASALRSISRRDRLLPALGHEDSRVDAIHLGKPLVDVGENRFHDHASAESADPDAVALEPEFAWQPHGLTPAVLK